MPKYRCTNEECEYYGEVMTTHGTKVVIKDGKAIDLSRACFNCGSDREVVREPGMTTTIAGTNDQLNRIRDGR